MLWVRIRLGAREYLGVLDTRATISILAKKILPLENLKNILPTAAIRMADWHVVHSCGDFEVEDPMGSRSIANQFCVMDTEAFDFVLGTDFFVEQSPILSLTLQAPYVLQVDHGDAWESVPLEQSEHTSRYLRVCKREPSTMMVASKTEDYQLPGNVLDQGLKELGLVLGMRKRILEKSETRQNNCSFRMKQQQKISNFMKNTLVFRENEKRASKSRTLRWFRLNNPLPQAILVFDIVVFGYLHSCISWRLLDGCCYCLLNDIVTKATFFFAPKIR